MSEIQYGYNCGDRQVSTSVIGKHSNRMRTACLPILRVVVATTRCQYWGGPTSGRGADIQMYTQIYIPPLDITPVHITYCTVLYILPTPIQKVPGIRHTYPHLQKGPRTWDIHPPTTPQPHPTPSPPPPLPSRQNDCQTPVKTLPFHKYTQWTLAQLTVIKIIIRTNGFNSICIINYFSCNH